VQHERPELESSCAAYHWHDGEEARGGEVHVLEGEPPPARTVVIEFPTRQAAIDWYRSEEYTSIRRLRDELRRCGSTSSTASGDAESRPRDPTTLSRRYHGSDLSGVPRVSE
jgi:uncharacterized protein (DUF1330 family)